MSLKVDLSFNLTLLSVPYGVWYRLSLVRLLLLRYIYIYTHIWSFVSCTELFFNIVWCICYDCLAYSSLYVGLLTLSDKFILQIIGHAFAYGSCRLVTATQLWQFILQRLHSSGTHDAPLWYGYIEQTGLWQQTKMKPTTFKLYCQNRF